MRLGRISVLVVGGLVLSLLTATRVQAWRGDLPLWAEAVRLSPAKPRPWVNLGKEYHLRGHHDLARWAYQTAIDLSGRAGRSRDEQVYGRAIAEANLALLRYQQGAEAEARRMVDAIVARTPVASVLALQAWMAE